MDGYKPDTVRLTHLDRRYKMKHLTYNKTNKYGVTYRTLLFDYGRKLIGIGCELKIETFGNHHNPLITLDRLLRIGPFVYTRKVQVAHRWMRVDNEFHFDLRPFSAR